MTRTCLEALAASFLMVASGFVAPAAACTTGACACGGTVAADTKVVFDGTEAIVTGSPCSTNPALRIAGGASLDMNGQRIRCNGSFTGINCSERSRCSRTGR